MMDSNIRLLRTLVGLLALFLASHGVLAQEVPSESGEYQPTVGQPGKDIVWIPTPDGLVQRMLELASVGPEDYVIDLGSGDGRTVIMAAEKFGASGLGIEYNPDLVALSNREAKAAGVSDKVAFVEADLLESDFSQGTVITMYLSTILNLKLRPKLLALRPGTRVVSHAFTLAAWQPDEKIALGSRNAYLWFVPAHVAGNWRLTLPAAGGEEGWTLTLDQMFQMLSGRVHHPDGSFEVVDGRMKGKEIRFHFIDSGGNRREVYGSASGNHMEGILLHPDETSLTWSAVRVDSSNSTRR